MAPPEPTLADRIEAVLPQTQCRRCTYDGCRPYAEAMAAGEADINQCPPGGAATISALAALTGRRAVPLNPAHGVEAPPRAAMIDEAACIGCARCLKACPVDAIVGAAKFMHTVIAEDCTGCELCLAPCPVDCIAMVQIGCGEAPQSAPWRNRAAEARRRFEARNERLARERAERADRMEAKRARLAAGGRGGA